MNTARIVVLAISVAAGGVAIYLVSGSEPKPVAQTTAPQFDTVDVLVAKSDIAIGQTVSADNLQWQTWPTASASTSFVRRNIQPAAPTQLAGSIARSSFVAGEPIREPKLVKGPGSGIMAAILPAGMRAISTDITTETGASGFILPNDRVDVLLSHKEKNSVVSEIVLGNIRVLAIDQTIEEKNGQKVVVGKTATLELKPEQAEALIKARQVGKLTLALRSIADANAPTEAKRHQKNSINVVRFGVPASTTLEK